MVAYGDWHKPCALGASVDLWLVHRQGLKLSCFTRQMRVIFVFVE